MIGSAPAFWWRAAPDWRATALTPLSLVYGAIARSRLVNAPREKIGLPVLCVGNFTVGGSGKTPVAIALAGAAAEAGLKPGFLTRGHGGGIRTPHLVDPGRDDEAMVGDEPLLLAAHAPVAVTPDRARGARLLAANGCDFVIMDDGFQSARIHIDHSLIVFDGRYGVGNGHVLPAGPLRAPLADQIAFADAFVRVGEGSAAAGVLDMASKAGKPVHDASIHVRDAQRFVGRRVLAFAGIGHPDKFFDTVRSAGGVVEIARPFPDHHAYGEAEIVELLSAARDRRLAVVTTAKDAARLGRETVASGAIDVLEIEIAFSPADAAGRIVEQTMLAWHGRLAANKQS